MIGLKRASEQNLTMNIATMPKWAERLIREVLERDERLCILCGAPVWNVHHIVPRGRKSPFNRKTWRKENMACICQPHHDDGQTVWMRVKLLQRMIELYAYDMAWATEFMGAWED